MNSKLRNQIIKFLREVKIDNPINITLTEKQFIEVEHKGNRKRIILDEIKSERNFRHFKNVLNKKLFGNSYWRFKNQLGMIVVREVSKDNRYHLRCIIEQPKHLEFNKFKELIESIWKKSDFGYYEIHIEKPTSHKREVGWFNYIMKDNIETFNRLEQLSSKVC